VPLAIAALRLPGQHWYEAIGLKLVPLGSVIRWTVIWLVCWIFAALLYWRLAPTDPFLQAINASRHWGLALTSLLLAPLLEEIIFRACGFQLWRQTRLGMSGTLFLTSLLFMLIHVEQYSLPLLILMFFFGVLLGLAREKTGSLLIPLILHTLNNFLAIVLVMWLGLAA